MLNVENKHIMLSVAMLNAFILNVVVPEMWQSKLGHFIRPSKADQNHNSHTGQAYRASASSMRNVI